MAGGASSSSSRLFGPLNRGNHEVFISFRGEDTRKIFTCHLHGALTRENINAFIDYELHKGDEISPSLLRAIEESYVSVVVFSESYASSKWCLEELVKIMECRRDDGQVVIPVFYEIDPSHVRNQIGSYKEAFEEHENNSKVETNKVQKWKDALTEAANLAGWDSDSRSYRDDFELIQKIVKDVLQKLDNHYPPNNAEGFIGISRNFAALEWILREARSIGIWGMGGIGKTTIARYIFDRYSHQYKGSCFLENVRERSGERGQGLQDLRNQLYSNLLPGEVCTTRSTLSEQRLRRQSNLIVLDDASSLNEIKYLVGELNSFGPNSRIIITTRDKSVLESTKVEHIHTMKVLDNEESLILFSLNAFNEKYPEIGYKKLSRRAVAYCRGIPLALRVLGSFLHSKSENEWDSALKKLEKIPNEEIQNVLRMSYDGLSYEEKQIFLDIACFFAGEPTEHVIDVLDNCDLFPAIGIRTLHDKALINIYDNGVWMHDLIQEMGWEIVRQESIENPGSRSRLWDFDDICYVLKNNKGTDAIKSIELKNFQSQSGQNLCLSSDTFKKMPALRYLKFVNYLQWHSILQFPSGLESLPNELRYFEWRGFPLSSLPSNFCPEKLVTLKMLSGQFERLWDGVQNLANLKNVNLKNCVKLMELPDFSKAKNLKIVNLSGCRRLQHVHPSILSLNMLRELYLDDCVKLETLESRVHLRSLCFLNVDGCLSLWKFSLSAEEIEILDLARTGIKVLGSSIGRFKKLEEMNLSCLRLENLPKELSCLKSLKVLSLSGCGEVISKQNLHAIFDGLQSLCELYLDNCHHLFELPDNVIHLSLLTILVLDESHVEKVPESIKDLSRLKTLSLSGCKFLLSLPELPASICHLEAVNCTLLQIVAPNLFNSGPPEEEEQEDKYVTFQNCGNLDMEKFISPFCQNLSELLSGYQLRRRRRIGGGERHIGLEDRIRIIYPNHKVPEWFTYRSKGASITFELAPPFGHNFGSLLCVVLSPFTSPLFRYPLSITCESYLEDGGKHIYLTTETVCNIWDPCKLHHVCISYDFGRILERAIAGRVNNQGAFYSYNRKVTFIFSGQHSSYPRGKESCLLIKECGVHLVNASDYANEIGAEHGTKRQRREDTF